MASQQQEQQSKKALEEKKFETDSKIPVKPLYTSDNLPQNLQEKLGVPASFPFTRGIYRNMYRDRLWTMRQYTGFGSAEDTNKRFHYLLKQGQTGLSTAFDLPTQLGLDSDNPKSEGEVGKVGVAISTLEDMQTLFSGIPLDKVSTSMTINATAATMLSMYVATAESLGVQRSLLKGTTQNDILKEYAARNTYIYPPDQSFDLCIDIIAFCADQMPNWHPISISGYHMREAGANAVQEIAYTFADAIEYVKGVVSRGYEIDSFCSQLSFFFVCRNDFMEEIAKFRAARRIWAKIVRDKFNSKSEESMRLKYHVQTSGESLTAQQSRNNIIRVSIQALAAVLGGAQSLHTNSFDEALGLPTEEAVTIALRTQHIIAEESGVTKTVDPLGGSYYLESLTDEIEAKALEELEKVEKLGGALAAIKSGYIQGEIQKSAYEFQKQVDEGRRTIVGVNKYNSDGASEAGKKYAVHRISDDSVSKQIRSLKRFRSQRDNSKVRAALARLEEQSAKSPSDRSASLMELIIDAVKAKATTGEISDAMRASFGEYRPRQLQM